VDDVVVDASVDCGAVVTAAVVVGPLGSVAVDPNVVVVATIGAGGPIVFVVLQPVVPPSRAVTASTPVASELRSAIMRPA
jgi:hypothetical protein